MKRSILLFLLAFVLHAYVASGTVPFDNGVALWGNLGYNTLSNFCSDVQPVGCAGAHLGVGWDAHFQQSDMLLQIGVELGYSGSFIHRDDWNQTAFTQDSEGDPVEMNYFVHQVYEYASSGDAGIQALVGYAGQSGVYFLLGPSVRYCFLFHSYTSCQVQSTGRYQGFIGDDGMGLFGSDVPMNDHFFSEKSYRLKSSYDSKPLYQFHLELGYATRSSNNFMGHKNLYRVAAFVDAGYMPVGNSNTQYDDMVYLSMTDVYKPQANAFLWRNANSGLGQLSVGIKFTVIWSSQNRKCMCYQ